MAHPAANRAAGNRRQQTRHAAPSQPETTRPAAPMANAGTKGQGIRNWITHFRVMRHMTRLVMRDMTDVWVSSLMG